MWADGDGTADKKVNNPGEFFQKSMDQYVLLLYNYGVMFGFYFNRGRF
jgi:hypothetical protein